MTSFPDRTPWAALAFHPLVLERQRDLSYPSQARLQPRHEFVDTRDPDHVGRSVHVERLAAATRVGTDDFARLGNRLDAAEIVIGLDRELRPDPGTAGRVALGLPFRGPVPVACGGGPPPVPQTDILLGGRAALGPPPSPSGRNQGGLA